LLFAINRLEQIIEALVVDQAIARVFCRESFDFSSFVLQGTTINAVGHSNVERPGVAAHDVNEIFVFSHTLYCNVILSEMDRSLGERSMQSKDPTIAEAIDCCAGNSYDAVVRMPFWTCARVKRYGVLRLRSG
jgi:hypothetical protein